MAFENSRPAKPAVIQARNWKTAPKSPVAMIWADIDALSNRCAPGAEDDGGGSHEQTYAEDPRQDTLDGEQVEGKDLRADERALWLIARGDQMG